MGMSTTLEIPDSLFVRLQKHAIPFVDLTPVSVLQRWADHFEGNGIGAITETKVPAPENPTKKFNPLTPPDLMHT